MFFTIPQRKREHQVRHVSLWSSYLRFFLLVLSIFTIYQTLTITLLVYPNVPESKPFAGAFYFNPYQTFVGKGIKLALHTHSDSVWYTPERHTVAEIFSEYKKEGFSQVAITDYGQITDTPEEMGIPGYEWGQNIKKRHVLVLGATKTYFDYFPVYASRENLRWVFSKMKSDGAYVVVPHPKLHNAYAKEEILALTGYDAVEVFSPFGDDSQILDSLLSRGQNIHCMANDDLHYFPESTVKGFTQPFWKDWIQWLGHQRGRKGESFQRYIVMPEGTLGKERVLLELHRGNFFCVKKFFREAIDPKVPQIRVVGNTIKLLGGERYLEIRWIGENGNILQINPDTETAEYKMLNEDPYVRLEIVSLSGKILSNAIYRFPG